MDKKYKILLKKMEKTKEKRTPFGARFLFGELFFIRWT